MMDGSIRPLYIIYSGIEDYSQVVDWFFFKYVSAPGLFWSLVLLLFLIWNAIIFPIALCGRCDWHLTWQCRWGAPLPARNHHSPLCCLCRCLSETWRACLVFEQNCWTVSCNALLTHPAVTYWFWFLLGWFASKLSLHVYVLHWLAKRGAEICLSDYVLGKNKPILLTQN